MAIGAPGMSCKSESCEIGRNVFAQMALATEHLEEHSLCIITLYDG